MTIGIELGWQGVRVVTVSDEEILSVGDKDDPSVVSTVPVVASKLGGALVGRLALDITGDEELRRELHIQHALVATNDADHPAFPLLMEKLARDLRAAGKDPREVTFVVSDEVSARSLNHGFRPELTEPGLVRLCDAARQAGFTRIRLAYRAEAAALQGWAMRWHALAATGPTVRALVVDLGFQELRLTTVDLNLQANSLPQVAARSTSATDPNQWVGEVQDDRVLEYTTFGHLARVVTDQTGATLSPAGLNQIWGLLREQDAAAKTELVNTQNRRVPLDLREIRTALCNDVTRAVTSILQAYPALRPSMEKFVVVIGPLAQIEGMQKAIQDGLQIVDLGAGNVHLCVLPSYALASAARFKSALPSTEWMVDETAGAPHPTLRDVPINDGTTRSNFAAPEATSWSEPTDSYSPLDDVLERHPAVLNDVADLTAGAFGHAIGQYWAAKTDSLLRLQATAPTVSLKSIYDQHIGENSIGTTAAGESVSTGDAQAITDDTLDKIVAALGRYNFGPAGQANLRSAIVEGYRDARRMGALELQPYANEQRALVLPHSAFALVSPGPDSGDLPTLGIIPTGSVVLSGSAIVGTAPADDGPLVRLGYSSDGFRQILATENRQTTRSKADAFWNTLMGGSVARAEIMGHAGLVLASMLVSVVLGLAAVYPSFPSWLWPRKSPMVTAKAPDGWSGVLECPNQKPCTISDTKPLKVVASELPKGCYVGMIRVVTPVGDYVAASKINTIVPPAQLQDLQCRGKSFDVTTVLRDLGEVEDKQVLTQVTGAPTATQNTSTQTYNLVGAVPKNADGTPVKVPPHGPQRRETVISQTVQGKKYSVVVTDIVWSAYSDGEVSLRMKDLFTFNFQNGNDISALCFALPFRFNVLPLDRAIAEPSLLQDILERQPSQLDMIQLIVGSSDRTWGMDAVELAGPPKPAQPGAAPPAPDKISTDFPQSLLWGLEQKPKRLIGKCTKPT